MEFRHTWSDPPREMSVSQFSKLVRAGGVPPTALYRATWTNGEWHTVDNLLPFHKNSSVKYPRGEILREEIRNEERKKQQEAEVGEKVHRYIHGSMIEDSYGLPPLRSLAAASFGAARFFVLPSFLPERIFTVVFNENGLTLSAVCGKTWLWESIPQIVCRTAEDGRWQETETVPFDAGEAFRAEEALDYDGVPEEFRSWETFYALVSGAGSCSTSTLDGVGYRHQTAGSQGLLEVSWGNPDQRTHHRQHQIIEAYEQLIVQAGLGQFLHSDC